MAELGQQFVLLRLTSLRGVNLELFDFDYDLNWSGLFLTPDDQVLGRFGGRTPDSVDKYRNAEALRFAMERALQRFKEEVPAKPATTPPPRTVEQYPGFVKFGPKSCVHCHHAYDLRRQMLQETDAWTLDEVWVYPLPENVGWTLAVNPGNLISAVAPKTPAESAGMKAGDVLLQVHGANVASFTDVQYALHKAPAVGEVSVKWVRGGEGMQATLRLESGWRRTDVSWRRSLRGLEPGSGLHGEDLTAGQKTELGLSPLTLAFRHGNFPTPQARQAGIQQNDIILGVDGKKLEMSARQFDAHIRTHYRKGDLIAVDVLRDGKRLALQMKLPG